jgi:predicted TIM-barrel fold metal-dependent hydrolase
MLPGGGKKSAPDDALASPIAFRPCSNGEYPPAEEDERDRLAERRFREIVDDRSRRLGISRRAFVESACGTAAALAVIGQVYGCADGGEAVFDVPDAMTLDAAQACARLEGDELIFDVQIHPPSPLTPWTSRQIPTDAETLVRTIFVGSDTAVGCVSGVPGARNLGLATVAATQQLREIIDRLAGPRLLLHANVDPTRGAAELDYMADVLAAHPQIGAWKVYPHVGSWRLDQGVGPAFIERARALGVKVIAAHRGIGPGTDYAAPSSPVDLVLAAKQFPDVTFLTYHSGWDAAAAEDHPFDPANQNPVGIDRLVKAARDSGIGPGGNVYAELGSTWRGLMTSPLAAAHAIGKLLVTLGEDRVVWGTDSVFTGSPQEQIAAFRAFQIPAELRDAHGYPEITDGMRRKIFGLNAAQVYGVDVDAVRCAIREDDLAQLKAARRADPRAVPIPSEKRYGPATRREFLAFLRWERDSGLH